MTAGPNETDYADRIVLPFTMTIPDPRRPVQDGMSRLEPIKVHPANGWADQQNGTRRSPSFSLANWLGIPSARAQEGPPEEKEQIPRRGFSGQSLTLAEEYRLELYEAATRRLIELEPGNPELAGIATPDYVPNDEQLARRQDEVAKAEVRNKRAIDHIAGRRALDPADIVAPGGRPVGYQFRSGRHSAAEHVRTVSKSEFEALRAQLRKLGCPREFSSRYGGEWYMGPDGIGFGFRMDRRDALTIDVQSPPLNSRFRIHQP